MKDNLSTFIKDPSLERLELSLKKPNFFSILRIQTQEIRHSNFLAWLLDPNEGHNISNIFLKWFLKDIFSGIKVDWTSEFEVDKLNLNKIQVVREFHNIDLLIIGPDFVICVENKIFSSEHSQQLKKYREVLEKEFPDKKKVFVFLNVYGESPETEDDSSIYVQYTYDDIKRNVEIIISVYSDSLSPRVKFYIEDYLTILKREIMKEDELIDLAKEIYQNHKEALDFIFDNKPDRLSEVSNVICDEIKNEGYELASLNKGYARFLTKELNKIIPKTGNGWKNRESFLLEIDFWPKKIAFKSVISPGNENVRKILSECLLDISGATNPRGASWLVHHTNKKQIDVTDDKYENDDLLRKEIKELLVHNKELINSIEKEILKRKDELIAMNSAVSSPNTLRATQP